MIFNLIYEKIINKYIVKIYHSKIFIKKTSNLNFFINMGVRVSLDVPRLITQVLKLTTM
jgi:hypothetical protein